MRAGNIIAWPHRRRGVDDLHIGEPTANATGWEAWPNLDANAVQEPEPGPPPTIHSELCTPRHCVSGGEGPLSSRSQLHSELLLS